MEAVRSLQERGYYAVNMDGAISLFSNEGEMHALMKTGVEYVLRFGAIAGDASSLTGHKKDDKDKKPGEKEATKPGLNRYLFVVAQFNPSVLPKPALEKLPEDKPAPKAQEKKADAKGANRPPRTPSRPRPRNRPPSPTSRPSASGSRRRTSGSRKSTTPRSRAARTRSRSSTPASATGIT